MQWDELPFCERVAPDTQRLSYYNVREQKILPMGHALAREHVTSRLTSSLQADAKVQSAKSMAKSQDRCGLIAKNV